ncbi:RidA family protein [Roseibium marinum]|uniref:Enamine deaminase RidA (YjgF/YER057c/UK114 family) n=1 Tax=Roseibium marinum TaxID=281252 RepID=A0A2S3V2S2_9HYPH|nr:RidA family protein [Roseibium marinum]POF34083.1 enamine deaminase RidA (YjgF/YER057c/UK114 family) [Roseibium marinum]
MSQLLQSNTPEARLRDMGLTLPQSPPNPIGSFCNARSAGGMVYVSGQGPVDAQGVLRTGTVGADVSVDEARQHARLVALNILSALRAHCGSLDQVAGVVKLQGLVNATPEFAEHPAIIDEASNLIAGVFGKSGVHARTSFGVASLPNRITVEIDAIFELAEGPVQ